MKKILIAALMTVGLSASTINVKQDGSIIRYEYTKKENAYILSNKKLFENDVKVIIEFNDKSKKEQLEQKYNLQNGKVFYGNLFIYEQNGADIVGLFEKLANERDIQNVYPNWITIHKKY